MRIRSVNGTCAEGGEKKTGGSGYEKSFPQTVAERISPKKQRLFQMLRVTLPAFRQDVQTLRRFGAPFTSARTR